MQGTTTTTTTTTATTASEHQQQQLQNGDGEDDGGHDHQEVHHIGEGAHDHLDHEPRAIDDLKHRYRPEEDQRKKHEDDVIPKIINHSSIFDLQIKIIQVMIHL